MSHGPAYEWKLRELMALRGMFSTSDLIQPLADRGIELSRSQVYRLVADTPERVQLSLLLALCDILGCQLQDLAQPVQPGQAPATPAKRRIARRAAGAERAEPLPPAIPRSFFDRP